MKRFFWLFLASGFCSLVDEIAWLRLAMAQFGVTMPVVSLFLSVFMAGIGLGSWLAGESCRRRAGGAARTDLRLYALCELGIGLGAATAPLVFSWGHAALNGGALGASWAALPYYGASGAWIAAGLLPWCLCMGATIPLGMSALGKLHGAQERSFSYLYLANVVGAAAGSLLGALALIELLGFHGTLLACGSVNVALAAAAFHMSREPAAARAKGRPAASSASAPGRRGALAGLFALGCAGLGFEVLWTRLFGIYLGHDVYALGSILAIYLLAAAAGSAAYRAKAAESLPPALLWTLLGASAMLPLLFCDPRLPAPSGPLGGELRLAFGIVPVCFVMGLLTPALVDRWSDGDPGRAGRAYAVNVLGCIAGPLLAGVALSPWLGERWTLAALALPFLAAGWRRGARGAAAAGLAASLALGLLTIERWQRWPSATVRRDYAATVVAGVAPGGMKLLMVNGNLMTILTPITKLMAHLPLAFLAAPPKSALTICFGMGTTYRSLSSWDISATAVELIPSVPRFFSFFHPDAERVARLPNDRIVVDDGRRFLERTAERFDVITIDPPPPPESPGSSLLYSKEFYAVARRRLSPGGILQQWHMGSDDAVTAAMARALGESFPYVRVFPGIEGWGFHFLASDSPIPSRTPEELARRLPSAAAADLVEWGPNRTAVEQFRAVLAHEIPLSALTARSGAPALTDDRPINEYFLLRRLGLLRFAKN